ncbi:hypothetical protein AAE028_34465, partial [Sinorhizobium sp. CB9]
MNLLLPSREKCRAARGDEGEQSDERPERKRRAVPCGETPSSDPSATFSPLGLLDSHIVESGEEEGYAA